MEPFDVWLSDQFGGVRLGFRYVSIEDFRTNKHDLGPTIEAR